MTLYLRLVVLVVVVLLVVPFNDVLQNVASIPLTSRYNIGKPKLRVTSHHHLQ